jgi:hypothetical protein
LIVGVIARIDWGMTLTHADSCRPLQQRLLWALIEARGLGTLTGLARAAGCDQSLLSRILVRERRLTGPIAKRVATTLRVRIADARWLLAGDSRQ